MKKLLITGFEPFGGESINPSWQAVLRLPNVVGEYELTKLCIPVVFGKATKKVIELALFFFEIRLHEMGEFATRIW